MLGVLCASVAVLGLGAQTIHTLVGGAVDGRKARQTPLWQPAAVAAAPDGSLYIADEGSHAVRRIDPVTGIAHIVAGGGTTVGVAGPAPARWFLLRGTTGLAVAADVRRRGAGIRWPAPAPVLYLVDGSRVRKLGPDGLLVTVAGAGTFGFSGDGGPATQARLSLPRGIALDPAGNLYISDSDNNAIRKVDAVLSLIHISEPTRPY